MKNKYYGLNLGCIIFSILVIAIHTSPFYNITDFTFNKILQIIYELAVPFFFIKCGFFLEEKRLEIVLLKYIKMYVFWTVIYLPLSVYEYVISDFSVKKSIILFIKGFFVYGKHFYSQQLWFLLSSIYGLIYIYIFNNVIKIKKYILIWMSLFLYLIALNYFEDYKISRIFMGGVYILSGVCLKDVDINHNILYEILICIVAGIIKYFNNDICISFVINIIMSICIFTIFLELKHFKRNNIILRKISTYIYFIHTYIIFVLGIIFKEKHFLLGWEMFLSTLFFSSVISMLCINIKNRYNNIYKGDFN